MEEIKERERQLKERLLREQANRNKTEGTNGTSETNVKQNDAETSGEADLDKVVIKKRAQRLSNEKDDSNKSLTVRTPKNLVGKLAMKLKELPKPAVEPSVKTDKEKVALKKKIKDKYAKSDLPEKILYLALENVAYEEDRVILLLDKMTKDNTAQSSPTAEEIVTLDDDDQLDYEAEEPEN